MHLTTSELVDAVEDTLDLRRRDHLERCARCRQQVEQLSTTLAGIPASEVPEPSPLFWDHLSARVRAAVAEEAVPTTGWRRWWRWQLVAAAGAVAVVVVAASILWTPGRDTTPAPTEASVVSDTAAPAGEFESESQLWEEVADIMGPIDWEDAAAAGLNVGPGDAEMTALSLTADEQRELSRLLTVELERSKS